MRAGDLLAVVKAVGPVMRQYVAKELIAIAARVEALEQRQVVVKDGAPGERGPEGPVGAPGLPGERGDRGEKGDAGDRGEVGPQGERGADGAIGPAGPQGVPGRDGLPGVPGPAGDRGADGMNGKDGAPGKDGRDGTLENIKVAFDGRRTVTLCFKDGTPIEGGTLIFPVPLDAGMFKAGTVYQCGDGVSCDNSFWIAQQDNPPGRPGTDKSGWRLAVRKGDKGAIGPQGPAGPRGPQGERGPERW